MRPLTEGEKGATAVNSPVDVDKEIKRLAELSSAEYEHCRRAEAKRLNMRASVLDREVRPPVAMWNKSMISAFSIRNPGSRKSMAPTCLMRLGDLIKVIIQGRAPLKSTIRIAS